MAGYDTVKNLTDSDKERKKNMLLHFFTLLQLMYKGAAWFKDGNSSNGTDVLIFDLTGCVPKCGQKLYIPHL